MAIGTATFDPNRNLTVQTGPVPSAASGFMQGIPPELLARLVAARMQPPPQQAAAPGPRMSPAAAVSPTPYVRSQQPFQAPQMEAPPLPKTKQKIGRYSYGFTSQLPGGAGTAPHLPTYIGEGREGVDFILEGGPQNWTGGAPRPIANTGDGRMESQKDTEMTDAQLEARRGNQAPAKPRQNRVGGRGF